MKYCNQFCRFLFLSSPLAICHREVLQEHFEKYVFSGGPQIKRGSPHGKLMKNKYKLLKIEYEKLKNYELQTSKLLSTIKEAVTQVF